MPALIQSSDFTVVLPIRNIGMPVAEKGWIKGNAEMEDGNHNRRKNPDPLKRISLCDRALW